MTGRKKTVLLIVIVAVVVFAAVFLILKNTVGRDAGPDGEEAYVDTVAAWTGAGAGLGGYNRFAGVVEAQETWSAQQNQDSEILDIYVKPGDEVKAGDPLFKYDVDKYQSDLSQAEIDMERLNNDLGSIEETINKLTEDKKKAPAADQANYTIQIQDQELAYKQKELDIKSKQMDIDRINENIKNAVVTSEIDGVVKSVKNEGTDISFEEGADTGVVTVMKTGDLRIKGTVNEQNIGELTEGMEMIIHSRVNEEDIWHGTIEKIDLENTEQDQGMYYGMESEGSTKKAFYVRLDSGEGLMIGQHVYLEADMGQDEKKEGLWLDEYLIDMSDADAPFVWADEGGRLTKRAVELGQYDEELMQYEVLGGLTLTDSIAMPSEELKEGMKTVSMKEMTDGSGEGDGSTEAFSVEAGEDMLTEDAA